MSEQNSSQAINNTADIATAKNLVLDIKNLSKKYGSQAALTNVSFQIPEGKIVGLLGPNGSGKTTIIKIVNDILHDYQGEVLIAGKEPGLESKRLISYLPDRPHLPNWISVKTAINMFKDFHQDFDADKASSMLQEMDVPLNRRIKQLSKGMHEKLQLSLVMSRAVKLYILDEPIAGVDPASRDFILRTILNNFAPNSSILLSTHIISDVESIFDSVVFLKHGQVFLSEAVDKLREQNNKSVDELFREVFAC